MKKEDLMKLGELIGKTTGDAAFKAELLLHPKKVMENAGISLPSNLQIKAWENQTNEYHIVIPEKPIPENHQVHHVNEDSSLEEINRFLVTKWLENGEEKKKIQKDPMAFLQSFGIKPLKQMKILFHENNETIFHFVLPKQKSSELDELELREVSGGKKGGSAKSAPASYTIQPPPAAVLGMVGLLCGP